MIEKTVSHYRLLEKLGEGGMGVVYKAEDTKLKRSVALKFLPANLTQDQQAKTRFLHEARAASALDHPNICTIHEINETSDGQMFIVMAYYEGETLQQKIARGKLEVAESTAIAIQISQGLAKAHGHKIVHRDLKPANVIITKDGVAKILDFGLAKLAGQPRLTKTGSTVGTMAYMSPEQVRGEETDHRADIWALGVVLYEMLTGQLPFKADYEHAVMYSILDAKPQPASILCTEAPKGLDQIIVRSLAKNREERYLACGDILHDLRVIQSNTGSRRTLIAAKTGLRSWIGLKRASVKWLIVFVAFLLISFLAILPSFMSKPSQPNLIASTKSIAVLAFTDMSAEKDEEYFCDGIAEELINSLAQIPGLKVSARTSAFQFKERESDIQTIGKKLGVGTVLEGSVRKSGSKVRVTAQLINAADGFHLWSHTYERELADVLTIQDDLSRLIVEALQIKLTSGENEPITRRQSTSVAAYNLYLRGRYFLNGRTEQGLQKSIDYFQQAINLDPDYALAYAGLADVYNVLGGWLYLEPKEAYPKAKAAAQKALELDESLAEAHTAVGVCKHYYDWDWQGAESEYKRAIVLNPNYADAHCWYARFLADMGRHDDARKEIQKALELDPLSFAINAYSGELYLYVGQDDKAITQLKQVLEMDPEYLSAHQYLFEIYFRKGLNEEAFQYFMPLYSAVYDFTSDHTAVQLKMEIKLLRLRFTSSWF